MELDHMEYLAEPEALDRGGDEGPSGRNEATETQRHRGDVLESL
jgi:hypothetical protein